MAARKPAPSTLLKQAQAQIEKLEKDLAEANKSKDRFYEAHQKAEERVAQVHALVDALPGAPGRSIEIDTGGWKQPISLEPMTRLAAWLATRGAA